MRAVTDLGSMTTLTSFTARKSP
jgi:hypothetical protein